MPAVPISRANAWTYWSKGLIACSGVFLDADAPDLPTNGQLANIALKRNHNAIRLWLAGAGDYHINEQDIINIALSPNGWDDTTLTLDTTDPQKKIPLSKVTAQVTNVLNIASSLGFGVLPVVDFHKTEDGKLWSNELVPGSASLKYRDALAAFWVKTFRKWRNHPALIGFDILNEPSPTSNGEQYTFESFRNGTNASPKETRWPAIAQQIITAIRTEEGATPTPLPLIVQGIYTGSANGLGVFAAPPPIPPKDGAPSAFLMDPQNRLVYSFHTYDPDSFCDQGVQQWGYEEIGTPYPLPGAVWIGGWNNGVAYHNLVNFRNADDLATYLKTAAEFKATYKVPIFVGEFSAVQPSIDQAWKQAFPQVDRTIDPNFTHQNFRVSDVQSNTAWEAPLLANLATVRKQTDYNAVVSNMITCSGGSESSIYEELLDRTGRRWITELQIDTNGIAGSDKVSVTAVFGHLGARGFWIRSSDKSPAEIVAANPAEWDMWSYPAAGTNFVLKTTAQIVGQFYGADIVTKPKPGEVVSIDMVGRAYHMATPQPVSITCRQNTIKFSVPVSTLPSNILTQAVKDAIKNGVVSRIDTLTGATVNAATKNGTAPVQLPVALLWLESPYTGDQIDQARLAYMRDALHVFQSNGYSWSYHADGVTHTDGAAFWQASVQMGELMSTAAAGRRLAPR